jgi:hypothetical protein
MGANLRPDSTAVNSWAVKMLFERELIETKIKEKDTRNWKLQKQLLGLWVISQISN